MGIVKVRLGQLREFVKKELERRESGRPRRVMVEAMEHPPFSTADEAAEWLKDNWTAFTGEPASEMHQEGHWPPEVDALLDELEAQGIDPSDFGDAWTNLFGYEDEDPEEDAYDMDSDAPGREKVSLERLEAEYPEAYASLVQGVADTPGDDLSHYEFWLENGKLHSTDDPLSGDPDVWTGSEWANDGEYDQVDEGDAPDATPSEMGGQPAGFKELTADEVEAGWPGALGAWESSNDSVDGDLFSTDATGNLFVEPSTPSGPFVWKQSAGDWVDISEYDEDTGQFL